MVKVKLANVHPRSQILLELLLLRKRIGREEVTVMGIFGHV